jgi:hypothetical protein
VPLTPKALSITLSTEASFPLWVYDQQFDLCLWITESQRERRKKFPYSETTGLVFSRMGAAQIMGLFVDTKLSPEGCQASTGLCNIVASNEANFLKYKETEKDP